MTEQGATREVINRQSTLGPCHPLGCGLFRRLLTGLFHMKGVLLLKALRNQLGCSPGIFKVVSCPEGTKCSPCSPEPSLPVVLLLPWVCVTFILCSIFYVELLLCGQLRLV